MALEIELKLALPAAAWPQLARVALLRTVQPSRQRLHNIYYDTDDLELRRSRIALRLRNASGRWLQTIKCAAPSQGGLSSRPEWEHPFARHFDFSPVDLPEVRQRLEALKTQGRLQPIFETNFERRQWRLETRHGAVLVMADRGTIRAGKREAALCELELELDGGTPADLFEIAAQLAQELPLRTENRSKAQRAYALHFAEAPAVVRAAASPLQMDMSLDQAIHAVVSECLAHMQDNEAGVLESDDPEFVHQMRVGLRRLRAAFKLFRPALPHPLPDTLARQLRHAGSVLGAARDWEVLAHELIAPHLSRASAHRDGLRTLHALALDHAHTARERARAYLNNGEHGRLVIALMHFMLDCPIQTDRSLTAFAAKRLRRLEERVRELAASVREDDIDSLHALRIGIKNLRYAREFLKPLAPPQLEPSQREMTRAQSTLGYLNDLGQAGPHLLSCADNDPQRLAAVRALATLHMPHYLEACRNALALAAQLRPR